MEKILETTIGLIESKLLLESENIVIGFLKNYFSPDVEEVVFDKKEDYLLAKNFLEEIFPERANKIRLSSASLSFDTQAEPKIWLSRLFI